MAAKGRKAFRAGKDPSPKFTDLGEGSEKMEAPMAAKKGPHKWYPSFHVRKELPGVSKAGQTVTMRVKAKVRSMETRDDGPPAIGFEVREAHIEGD